MSNIGDKKERTRARIIAAALDLFATVGYRQTTIKDISAAADIAPRTFFLYFPSKESTLFTDLETMRTDLLRRLETVTLTGESIADLLATWLEDSIQLLGQDQRERVLRVRAIIDGNDALEALETHFFSRIATEVIEHFKQTHTIQNDIRADLVGAGIGGMLYYAYRHALDTDPTLLVRWFKELAQASLE